MGNCRLQQACRSMLEAEHLHRRQQPPPAVEHHWGPATLCGKEQRQQHHHWCGGVNGLYKQAGGKAKKREVVVPEPDYRIPIVLLGFAGVLVYQDNLLPAAPVGLLGLLLLFQVSSSSRNFKCDPESRHTEVKIGEELQESGENVFVGGKNRWKYSTFVNWELWWPNFPILVYFKEKQTKPEGQVHFFPVIFVSAPGPARMILKSCVCCSIFDSSFHAPTQNGKQLYDVMVERAGPSKTSGPKQT
ncbi:hypothetical protein Taro_029991 [Colocasia esculenta]|uniref:Uncharacterized protein n=1 Tax=Colocasia esculenta TaxID=4460 RepID=A0A843VWK1_COLES|nr:hypothetical protein [Colocasia esculenta]